MPVRDLVDAYGESLRVLDIDGYYIPAVSVPYDQEKEFRSIPTWTGRDDDIVLACYNRSGTHWLWEIINMLLAEKAERIERIKQSSMLEILSQEIYDKLQSPRVINTHLHYKHLPLDTRKRQCKIVLCIRNPKDVAVSDFNLHTSLKIYNFSGKWEHYVERFLNNLVDYGDWFDYVHDWEKVANENPEVPIHIVHYEDVKSISWQNGVTEIQKIARFLNKNDDEQLCKAINELCTFERMSVEKRQGFVENWKNHKPGFYRKGCVGDWKNWFTVAQNEYFDKVFAEKMAGSKLNIKFT